MRRRRAAYCIHATTAAATTATTRTATTNTYRASARDAVAPVALVAPRIALVVVPVALPEAGLVTGGELEAVQPLRRLPEVQRVQQHPHRPTVLRLQSLTVVLPGDQHVIAEQRREGHVRRVAVLR